LRATQLPSHTKFAVWGHPHDLGRAEEIGGHEGFYRQGEFITEASGTFRANLR
jgi:hypothetical protein